MVRYWIGVVSKTHVERGKAGSFACLCHGKKAPLMRMTPGDFLVYYSPTVSLEGRETYQKFTALGVVEDKPIEQVMMAPDFVPFRRRIQYSTSVDAPIRPLLPSLSFVRDKARWGMSLRRGVVEISEGDFRIIAAAMHVAL